MTGIGVATAVAGETVTFLGGQSTFFAMLGAREAVSSFWPMRVSPGTQTKTSTASSTEARASRGPDKWKRTGLSKALARLL